MPATTSTLCPQCRERKPKRACPALGYPICSICCATKRQVEIRCPASCPYLSSARAHPAATVQRRREKDLRFLLPLLSDLSETQSTLLMLFQSSTAKHAEGAIPPLLDLEVADAAAAVAATLETSGKGIIYEHQPTSIPAVRLAEQLRSDLDELLNEAGASRGRLERDAAVALRRVERAARTAAGALPEDEAPVYLRLLDRIMALQEAEPATEQQADGGSPGSRLIVPG